MKKYNHAFDIAFTVHSDDPKGATELELLEGIERRIKALKNSPGEIVEAVGAPFDTHENEIEQTKSHTPGPWEYDDRDSDRYNILIYSPWTKELTPKNSDGMGDYRGLHVATLSHRNDNPVFSKAQAIANAKLIAAAPDMLKALQYAVDILPAGGTREECIKAIQKATS